jgi:hypothetical protein
MIQSLNVTGVTGVTRLVTKVNPELTNNISVVTGVTGVTAFSLLLYFLFSIFIHLSIYSVIGVYIWLHGYSVDITVKCYGYKYGYIAVTNFTHKSAIFQNSFFL